MVRRMPSQEDHCKQSSVFLDTIVFQSMVGSPQTVGGGETLDDLASLSCAEAELVQLRPKMRNVYVVACSFIKYCQQILSQLLAT